MSKLPVATLDQTSIEAESKPDELTEPNRQELDAGTNEHDKSSYERLDDPLFVGNFDYRDYLFDSNSNLTGTELPNESSSSSSTATIDHLQSITGRTLLTLETETAIDTSRSPHLTELSRNFVLVNESDYTDQQQQQQQGTEQSNSAYLTETSDQPPNDYILFDTSMLDTSTDHLSEMQDTSGSGTDTTATTAITNVTKVDNYYGSPSSIKQVINV